jgi:predicted amidohydrolase
VTEHTVPEFPASGPESSAEAGSVIAAAQFAPGADVEANLATVARLSAAAVARGARLVVFPEYASYFSPRLSADFVDNAQTLDGSFADGIRSLATELGIHIVIGMVERIDERIDEPSRFSNTLIAVDPSGDVVARYRKLHLYDAFGDRESEWVRPGDIEEPELFEFDGFRVGLQTCYDLRFPEVTRRLVDAGATLVAVPSEWVRGPLKEHHWRTLATARALENTIYLVAADHTPPVGVGNSMIVDPMGVEIAAIGEIEGVAIAGVSRERIADVRKLNPALELRRFSVIPR